MKYTRMMGLAAFLALASACTAPDKATATLEDQGYTDIETTGFDAFACGQDDTYSTGFRAVSPAGHPVSGTVCSGWLKGSTIRFD